MATEHQVQAFRAAASGLADELEEAESEISRHHEDFQKIRNLVHYALDGPISDEDTMFDALEGIRNIVG